MHGGGIVYLMAKVPRPGRVKTRLSPPLSALQAAELSAAFSCDTLTNLVLAEAVEVRLALADDGGDGDGGEPSGGEGGRASYAKSLEELASRLGVPVADQGDGDLGQRMDRLLRRGLAEGRPTVLVGADAPDLPRASLQAALEALAASDAVLLPAGDGGYLLVGARRPLPGLFSIDAPWGSDRVFEATRRVLGESRASFTVLPAWEDVDDAAALGRLAARLQAAGAGVAPATSALLHAWRTEGVRF